MLSYVLRRLAISIVVLLLATILVFLLVAESGNPWPSRWPTRRSPTRPSWPGRSSSTSTTRCGTGTGSGSSHAVQGDFGSTVAGQPVRPTARLPPAGHPADGDPGHADLDRPGHRRRRLRRSPPEQVRRPRGHGDQLHLPGRAGVRGRPAAEGVRGHPRQPAPQPDRLLHQRRAEPHPHRLVPLPSARLRRPHRAPYDHADPGHLLVVGHLPTGLDPRDPGQRLRPPGPGQGHLARAGCSCATCSAMP